MPRITHLTLDVLKAHTPQLVEFATQLSARHHDYTVAIQVLEMDDKTETLEVVIDGPDLDFDDIAETISALGGSLHGVDRVVVAPDKPTDPDQ